MQEVAPTLRERAIAIARTQLGVEEQPRGSNKGKDVEKYLASVGLPGGNSWCMALVYWCYDQAAKELGVKNPLYKTGGVLNQLHHTAQENITSVPHEGDIFIIDEGAGLGHAGLVENKVNDYVNTIEGNTNTKGGREGFEVARRCRTIKSIKCFIHFQ